MKKLLLILILSLTILITSCETTEPVEQEFPAFTDVVTLPARPTLETIPNTSEAIKVLSTNLNLTISHIKILEEYITIQEKYYKKILTISEK